VRRAEIEWPRGSPTVTAREAKPSTDVINAEADAA
jgi:hypothetical protein